MILILLCYTISLVVRDMYDEYIMTFICVSECGSLLKAAEKLYLSSNAIKKRIDRLEERTKPHLFYAHLKE